MNKTVIFCTGESGSGKSYFIKNVLLPTGAVHNLKSATTRKMRDGEMDGREYYFRDEKYFDSEKFATHLFVNAAFWKPGEAKWLYGVPEFEVMNNLGKFFTYDVIQPMYVRQMIDWFQTNPKTRDYYFKILWFHALNNSGDIVKKRQNMPNDLAVRRQNTCSQADFDNAKLDVNHIVVSDPENKSFYYDSTLHAFIKQLYNER